MSEEALVEHYAVQEVIVDCFGDYEVSNTGLLSCAGYRTMKGVNVVVVRIVMPAMNLPKVIQNALEAAQTLPLPPMLALVSKRAH